MKIAHMALWSKNLDAQKAFWKEYFGGNCNQLYISKNRPGFTSYFVSLHEGPTIELMSLDELKTGQNGQELTGWAHIAISVGSAEAVDAMAARAGERGILVSSARKTGDGFYEAVICDPDGNLIEIVV